MARKTAKTYLHEVSEIDRHADFGRRHSFVSLIFAGVNDDASLNELQQNLCDKRINEAYSKHASDEATLTEAAMNIATFLNTCHATLPHKPK
ncbi:MAG: hypothetical protein WC250_01260 [Candidatus Paceibacterota bacterium]|jgi:hypothetical protein